MLLWTSRCRHLFELAFSFPMDIFPKVEWLDYLVVLFLCFLSFFKTFFWRQSTPFSTVAIPIFIPTCSAQGFLPHPHQHLLSLALLMMAILTCVSWYLTAVFICISLIISDAEHVFMCLLAISMSYFKKSIQVFCPFLTEFFYIE